MNNPLDCYDVYVFLPNNDLSVILGYDWFYLIYSLVVCLVGNKVFDVLLLPNIVGLLVAKSVFVVLGYYVFYPAAMDAAFYAAFYATLISLSALVDFDYCLLVVIVVDNLVLSNNDVDGLLLANNDVVCAEDRALPNNDGCLLSMFFTGKLVNNPAAGFCVSDCFWVDYDCYAGLLLIFYYYFLVSSVLTSLLDYLGFDDYYFWTLRLPNNPPIDGGCWLVFMTGVFLVVVYVLLLDVYVILLVLNKVAAPLAAPNNPPAVFPNKPPYCLLFSFYLF